MKTLLVFCALASATFAIPPSYGRRFGLAGSLDAPDAPESSINRTRQEYPKEVNTYAGLWENQQSLFDKQVALIQSQSQAFQDQSKKFDDYLKTHFQTFDDNFKELADPSRKLNQELEKLNEQVHAQTQAVEKMPFDRLKPIEFDSPERRKFGIQSDKTGELDKIGSKSNTFVAHTGPNGAFVVNDGHPNSKAWVSINGKLVQAEPGSVVIARGDKFYSAKLPQRQTEAPVGTRKSFPEDRVDRLH